MRVLREGEVAMSVSVRASASVTETMIGAMCPLQQCMVDGCGLQMEDVMFSNYKRSIETCSCTSVVCQHMPSASLAGMTCQSLCGCWCAVCLCLCVCVMGQLHCQVCAVSSSVQASLIFSHVIDCLLSMDATWGHLCTFERPRCCCCAPATGTHI